MMDSTSRTYIHTYTAALLGGIQPCMNWEQIRHNEIFVLRVIFAPKYTSGMLVEYPPVCLYGTLPFEQVVPLFYILM